MFLIDDIRVFPGPVLLGVARYYLPKFELLISRWYFPIEPEVKFVVMSLWPPKERVQVPRPKERVQVGIPWTPQKTKPAKVVPDSYTRNDGVVIYRC